MILPEALTGALSRGRLLVLWGALPWPLAARPPANRALALQALGEPGLDSAALAAELAGLPPLPILGLDPGDGLERAFAVAGLELPLAITEADVVAAGRRCLVKVGGDLASRRGVVLSRAELRELHVDRDKRHLLDEARRVVEGGGVLLVACEPGDGDFSAWWAALAPTFRGAALFAVGDAAAAWPAGVVCLGPDLGPVAEVLRVAWAEARREAEAEAEVQAREGSAAAAGRGVAQAGSGNIAISGDVQGGVTIVQTGGGDYVDTGGGAYVGPGARVEVEGGDFVGRDSAVRDEPAPDGAPPAGRADRPASRVAGYDLVAVRDLLLAAFTAEDLDRFFLYTSDAELQSLGLEFGAGAGLASMVDTTIRYCISRDLLGNLLREVERKRSKTYARFAGRLGG